MTQKTLITPFQNTWCPGCGNFSIQHAMKSALLELEMEELALDHVVLVAGIGCHGKIADYMDLNAFYALHGRAIPAATGIRIANPNLTVICHAGDGDAYAEGLDHLIFAAKRNVDMTVVIHDNRVYGLTTGQYTPTSPVGFKGRSTPLGTIERPFNPLHLAFASGATFIARSYTRRLPHLKETLKAAILHRGFSLVEVFQICATYYDIHDYYDQYVYELTDHDPTDPLAAEAKIREWDYNADAPIALGTFYTAKLPIFEENIGHTAAVSPGQRIERIRARLRSTF
jgi:2-oxoglutarate ferredoxin oxidoreductase subunit beta